MISGTNSMLIASEMTPAVMNMFDRPLCISHGVMANGIGIPTALRTKAIPTNASAVSGRYASMTRVKAASPMAPSPKAKRPPPMEGKIQCIPWKRACINDSVHD